MRSTLLRPPSRYVSLPLYPTQYPLPPFYRSRVWRRRGVLQIADGVLGTLTVNEGRMKEALKESLGECPVCTDPFECRKCTLLLSCSHLICATCFVKLREPYRCPICRR